MNANSKNQGEAGNSPKTTPIQRLAAGFIAWCDASDSKVMAASFDDFKDFVDECQPDIGIYFNDDDFHQAYSFATGGAK